MYNRKYFAEFLSLSLVHKGYNNLISSLNSPEYNENITEISFTFMINNETSNNDA